MAFPDTKPTDGPAGRSPVPGRLARVLTVASGGMGLVAVATWIVAPSGGTVAMVAVPLAIVFFQTWGLLRWRPGLLIGAILLDAEAILAAATFSTGAAFAILLPLLSVGIAQLQPNRRLLAATAVAALGSSLVALLLVVLTGPASQAITLKAPVFFILAATALAVAALQWAGWTRHEQAAALARDSALEIRAIIDAAGDAMVVVDDEGRIREVNEAALRLTGQMREAVTGTAGGHPGRMEVDGEDGWTAIRALFSPGEGDAAPLGLHRLTGKRPDGSDLPAEVSISQLTIGGRTAYLAVLRDISERVEMYSDLRHARELLAAIVAASPLAVISVDLAGAIQYFNPAAERLLGWSAEEAVGRPVDEVSDIPADQYEALLARTLAGEALPGVPMQRHARDGRPLDLRLFAAPLRDADDVIGAVAILEDVSERRALEAQLRQSQKLETLGQLSGAIAHDFNNLLQAIHGYAELARADQPGAELTADLEEIVRAADRASELTRQLKTFSQPGKTNAQAVDVNACVNQAMPMIRHLLGPTVQLSAALRPEAGTILIDPTQLEQAIVNLCVNGRDAMPAGGAVTIETGRRLAAPGIPAGPSSAARDWIAAPAPAQTLTFVDVSDTGVGISPEIRDRIFEPFFTTKETGQGTGLGLSIVYGIVRNASGDIMVESEPGRGTRFSLTFPSADPAEETAAAAVEPPLQGTETVLLVEDEEAVRKLAERVLREGGYRVLSAANAIQARQLWSARDGDVDLLLTDVTMPGMSGVAFAGELAASGHPPRTLFMSGNLPGEPGEPAVRSGARLLAKPFNVAALLDAVREALDAPPAGGGGATGA